MDRPLIWIAVFFFVLAGTSRADDIDPADQTDRWTFARCWQTARDNNPSIQIGELDLRSALLDVQMAKKVFYPTTTLEIGSAINTINNAQGVEASAQYELRIDPILEGYEKFFTKDMADFALQRKRLNREKSLEILHFTVAEAYLQLIAHHKGLKNLESVISVTRSRIRLQNSRTDPHADTRLKIATQLQLRRELLALNNLKSVAYHWRLKLASAIGISPDTPLSVDLEEDVGAVIDSPEISDIPNEKSWLASSQARVNQLEKSQIQVQRRVAGLNDWPRPYLRLGWSEGQFERDDGMYVVGGLQIPLWDWGRNEKIRKELDLQKRRQEIKQDAQFKDWRMRVLVMRRTIEDLKQHQEIIQQNIDLLTMQIRMQTQNHATRIDSADEHLQARGSLAKEQAQLDLLNGEIWVALSRLEMMIKVGGQDAQ